MVERLKAILAERPKRRITEGGQRSAVLIPLYYRAGQYYLVFTKRTERVKVHKGQISFPGGAYEAGDGSLLSTALREAEEEIGLKAADVEILGELDDELTRSTHYIVSPFVARIPWPYRFRVDGEEIEEIIEVPVTTLLDKDCLRQETEVINGETTTEWFYHCLGVVIWGTTARILNQFLALFARATGTA